MSHKKDVDNGSILGSLDSALDNIKRKNKSAQKAIRQYDKDKEKAGNARTAATTPSDGVSDKHKGQVTGKAKRAIARRTEAYGRIVAYEASTGCELDTFANFGECLAVMKESYGVEIQPSLLARNLEGLSRQCKGYIFQSAKGFTSEYEDRLFAFVSVRTGKIIKRGTIYELSEEARVTPLHILTKAQINETDKPEVFQALPVLCMELDTTGEPPYNEERATKMWKRYLEATMHMFPTVLDSKGQPLVSFYSIAEACKAIRAVSITEAVASKKIRDACYNETTYFGFDWCFKPGYVYCEYTYLSDDPEDMEVFKGAKAGEDPESFSVSNTVLRAAKTKTE